MAAIRQNGGERRLTNSNALALIIYLWHSSGILIWGLTMKQNKRLMVGASFQCPADLKAWIEQQAETNERSLSRQIVHILAEKRTQETAKVREEA